MREENRHKRNEKKNAFLQVSNLILKVAEHSFHTRFWGCNSACAQGFQKKNKQAINRPVTQRQHFLSYFSL